MRSFCFAFTALGVALLACGGKVVVDQPAGAGGAGAATASSNQSSTSTTNTGGTTGDVNPTTTTDQGTVVGAGGAGGGCFTCATYLTDCVATPNPAPTCGAQPLCPVSNALFKNLVDCVCGFCAMECANSCARGGPDTPACQGCQQMSATGPCSTQFAACANDV